MKVLALAWVTLLPCLAGSPDIDKEKALGGLGAPILIEVYSSFACSHCKDFHEKILPLIVRDYVVQGKVCVVNREFFPPNHAVAIEAANDATAAARIGKYQAVADALFRNQQQWVVSRNVWDTVASVLTPAQQKQVQSLAKDPAVTGEVKGDMDRGQAVGIKGTPTLYVTHGSKTYPLNGVPEYSLFKSFVDGLLAK